MSRTRAALGVVGAALLAAGSACGRWRAPAPRPNVLLIVWDTVRADRMSLYGHPAPTTPRMDRWARAQGVVFDDAVAPDMWTVPSHASLFTGLASRTHGAGIDHRWLDDPFVTVAEVLADAGWDTYAFSANPNLSRDHVNLLQGFHWIDTSFEDGRWARQAAAVTRDKLLQKDASTEISPGRPDRERGGLSFNAGPVAHRAFVEWLDTAHTAGRPWLAYLSYMEAHKPRVPSAAARRRISSDDTVHRAFRTDVSLEAQLRYSYGLAEYGPDELAAISETYDAALVDLDDATADLLDDLDARGLLEDTVVIFTSDHGEQLGEHHRLGHRMGLDQALVHVPLVVSWRGHLAPRRVAAPVSTAGLFHTALRLCGVGEPATGALPLDWLAQELPDVVFTESMGWDRASFRKVAAARPGLDEAPFARAWSGVRRGASWLVEERPVGGGPPVRHLYDAEGDPGETRDLAASDPAGTEALAALLAARDAATPLAAPAPAADALDEAERRQLELLGYVAP